MKKQSCFLLQNAPKTSSPVLDITHEATIKVVYIIQTPSRTPSPLPNRLLPLPVPLPLPLPLLRFNPLQHPISQHAY
jgi:hypothetical protein